MTEAANKKTPFRYFYYLKLLSASLLIVTLILLLILTWAISTTSGLEWLHKKLQNSLPELSIGKLEGKLIGPLKAENILYNNNDIDISIKELKLDWQAIALFKARLLIDSLTISNVEIYQSPATEKTEPAKEEKALSIKEIFDQLKPPVTIEIRNIRIDDAQFYQGSKKESPPAEIKLNSFVFQGIFDQDGLTIQSIAIDSDKGSVKGHAQLYTINHKDIEGTFDWSIPGDNMAVINGKTTLSGQLERLNINSELQAPYQSSVKLLLQNLPEKIDANGKIHLNDIVLNEINKQWPDYRINGESKISGNPSNIEASNLFNIEIDTLNKFQLNTTAQWLKSQLNINGSIITTAPAKILKPATLNFKGDIKTDNNIPDINISTHWENISWPLLYTEPAGSGSSTNSLLDIPKGQAFIQGNIESYNFKVSTDIQSTTNTENITGKLNIIGKGDSNAINLETLVLNGPLGEITGNGNFTHSPQVAVNLNLSGENINPGLILPNWPGDLGFNALITTVKDSQQNNIITSEIDASGKLRNHPVSLKTKALYGNNTVDIQTLKLTSGKSLITASSQLTQNQQLSGEWKLSSSDLSELLPNFSGKLYSQGKINSNLNSTAFLETFVDMQLEGSSIGFNDIKIGKADIKTNIDWQDISAKDKSSTTIYLDNIAINNTQIESVEVSGKGASQNHQLTVDLQSHDIDINTVLSGQFTTANQITEWLFSISDATLSLQELAPWKLEQNASGGVATNKQYIKNHCWKTEITDNNQNVSQKTGSLCLEGLNQGNIVQSRFAIKNLPSEYFSPLLPSDVEWKNSLINGNGSLSSVAQELKMNIAIDTTSGQFTWQPVTSNNTPPQSITVEPGKVAINNDNSGLTASLSFPLERQKGLYANIDIKNNTKRFNKRQIAGKVGLDLNNLTPFTAFIPDASDLKGELTGEWQLKGSIAEPEINGNLSMENGQVRLNGPGVFLENIALTLSGNQQKGILYQLSAVSGGGAIKVDGTADLNHKTPHINLMVTGNDVQLFATEEASLFVSPDITVKTNNEIIDIKGTLAIPKASITPKKVPASVVTTSADQVIIDSRQKKSDNKVKQKVVSDLKLILGDEVTMDGFGFKGRATGNLQVVKEVEGVTLGNGEIAIVDGEYRAFGQGLVIEKGNIIFAGGPINKPGVDVKALRRPAEGITVGVYARGSIAQPELTVFSEPSMTQSEQLSWLILGRPLEQSSEGEGNAINRLLLSMSLNRGDSLLNRFGDSLNLDTLSIKSGSGEAGAASDNDLAELVLGKYLSPDLYVSYGIGLFKPVNVLSLEYSLNRHWKLVSETSAESSGGDLIYTIEK